MSYTLSGVHRHNFISKPNSLSVASIFYSVMSEAPTLPNVDLSLIKEKCVRDKCLLCLKHSRGFESFGSVDKTAPYKT